MPTLHEQGAQRPPLGIFPFLADTALKDKGVQARSDRRERSSVSTCGAQACAGCPRSSKPTENKETSGGCSPGRPMGKPEHKQCSKLSPAYV